MLYELTTQPRTIRKLNSMPQFLTKENISALEDYISEHYLGAHGVEKESLEPICLDESIILAAPRTPKPTCEEQTAPNSTPHPGIV